MERIKMVNGNIIKAFTKEELNKELIAKGDWSIEYYVPGRVFYPYFITINKIKYRFEKLEKLEKFCKDHKKKDLEKLSEREICQLKWKYN